jgi:hypothetical protein
VSLKTFWMEPTGRVRVSLRKFTHGREVSCPQAKDGHDANTTISEDANKSDWWEMSEDGQSHRVKEEHVDASDPRWAALLCKHCGQPFDGHHQVWARELYRGAPDGKLYTLRDLPPGSMYDYAWLPESYAGADGIRLTVILPNGHPWQVDGPASNCTKPGDKVHKCWVRHGDPRAANLTVDKNGNTCAAGAGSIQAGDYHGFLRNGVLT